MTEINKKIHKHKLRNFHVECIKNTFIYYELFSFFFALASVLFFCQSLNLNKFFVINIIVLLYKFLY
jgi:hypothetical protein